MIPSKSRSRCSVPLFLLPTPGRDPPRRPSGACWDGGGRKDGRMIFPTTSSPGKRPQPSHHPLCTLERDSGPFRPRHGLGFGVSPHSLRVSSPTTSPGPPRAPREAPAAIGAPSPGEPIPGSRSRPRSREKAIPKGAAERESAACPSPSARQTHRDLQELPWGTEGLGPTGHPNVPSLPKSTPLPWQTTGRGPWGG